MEVHTEYSVLRTSMYILYVPPRSRALKPSILCYQNICMEKRYGAYSFVLRSLCAVYVQFVPRTPNLVQAYVRSTHQSVKVLVERTTTNEARGGGGWDYRDLSNEPSYQLYSTYVCDTIFRNSPLPPISFYLHVCTVCTVLVVVKRIRGILGVKLGSSGIRKERGTPIRSKILV